MKRLIQPEILDHLSPDDPRVFHARKDLRLINGLMNHARILRSSIFPQLNAGHSLRIVEIGSGDGALAYEIFKKWGKLPAGSRFDFVDKAGSLSKQVKRDLGALGWEVNEFETDVFHWIDSRSDSYDLCFASLFLHHFDERELTLLFRQLSKKIERFICIEPRRDRFGLLGALGLRLLGCDPVTLHDAKVSVRAGFHHQELSRIWNQSVPARWQLKERRAGLFSHFFSASSTAT
ncbi:class I SAM-dependent methyltransferase [bacterium]|mgnify:FL=1|nr:class I SAM-dependent methyltransferase [Verrucomicrobiota bacterium]MDA7682362.1 class I SAM-dependent methyltransferase [bacterium]MDB4690313.1 class I SAM-dependent methyltransferase [Verrucomicrobiota bacterium]MDB4705673.1 class I SAM-dependent methyltransferase [Verrucomicrobiota bacterium]MDB4795189.1 class I SAM-dependent methyltransferase [Verrucomicrobiota bacterium]